MDIPVVKVGGTLLQDDILKKILGDIAGLVFKGLKLVLVHGGGELVTDYSKRMGIEPRFVVSPNGIRSRYTSLEELEAYIMVMAGKISTELTARLESMGVRALGVSGVDCSFLKAERKKRIIVLSEKGRPRVMPGGYTGRIVSVSTVCLRNLLKACSVVVASPIALGLEGEVLNIDADQAAAEIAAALSSQVLVMLTSAPGVVHGGVVVHRLTSSEAEKLSRLVGQGMNRKLLMAVKALRKGVQRVIIAPGYIDKPVSKALTGKIGTVIEE